jgi:replicative DNA helicase
MEHARVAVKRLFGRLDERFQSTAAIPTGIACLDAVGGLLEAELAVITGHPGVGKTAFALAIARHALHADREVLYVSLAETSLQIIERMLLAEACVDAVAFRTGRLQRQDMTHLTYAAATLSKWSLQIEDAVDLDAARVREVVRDWRATTTRRALVIIDDLQLLTDDCDRAAALRTLVDTVKETAISLLLVSQLIADGRERAALESIATAVLVLRADTRLHEIVLVKHRHCETPQVHPIQFDGTRVADLVAVEPAGATAD